MAAALAGGHGGLHCEEAQVSLLPKIFATASVFAATAGLTTALLTDRNTAFCNTSKTNIGFVSASFMSHTTRSAHAHELRPAFAMRPVLVGLALLALASPALADSTHRPQSRSHPRSSPDHRCSRDLFDRHARAAAWVERDDWIMAEYDAMAPK
jgi:hypothetical protein